MLQEIAQEIAALLLKKAANNDFVFKFTFQLTICCKQVIQQLHKFPP
jgi:hypothetical protein